MWESLKFILPRAVKDAGINERVTAVRVLDTATQALVARWGEDKAARVKFLSFNTGTLKVETESPAAKQMLYQEKIDFINTLNNKLGERAVMSLDIRSRGF